MASVQDSNAFVGRVERMLRMSMDVGLDEQVSFMKEWNGCGCSILTVLLCAGAICAPDMYRSCICELNVLQMATSIHGCCCFWYMYKTHHLCCVLSQVEEEAEVEDSDDAEEVEEEDDSEPEAPASEEELTPLEPDPVAEVVKEAGSAAEEEEDEQVRMTLSCVCVAAWNSAPAAKRDSHRD